MGFEVLFQWLIDKIEELVPFRWVHPDKAGVLVKHDPIAAFLPRLLRRLPWLRAMPINGQWVYDVRAGVVFKLPFFDQLRVIKVKRRNVDIDNVTVLTADGKTLFISLTVMYRVGNPRRAILDTEDFDASLVTDTMSLITAWANATDAMVIDVASLVDACYEPIRKAGLQWGCDVQAIGVNSIAPHRFYRVLTE